MARPSNSRLKPSRKGAAFMAKLLAPLDAAELADPGLAKLEKKADRKRWEAAMAGCQAACAVRTAINYMAIAEKRGNPVPLSISITWDEAQAAYMRTIEDAMHIPAPHAGALKWKRAHVQAGTRFNKVNYPIEPRHAIIAADAARLENARA